MWVRSPPPAPQNNRAREEHLRTRLTKKNSHLAEGTIQSRLTILKTIQRRVNLWDSDEVQRFIDESDWSNGRREQVSLAYWDWCLSKGFEFKKKHYQRQYKIPYIPTEKEIDQLIGGFINSPYAPFLQLLKEAGFRPRARMKGHPINRYSFLNIHFNSYSTRAYLV